MNLDNLILEIQNLKKEEIVKRARIIVVEIINEFTKIYKTTDLFEKHKLMPWELLLRLSFAAIAGDNKLNKNEYELFCTLTEGLIDTPSPKELADEIRNSDINITITIIDDFVDTLGKKMAKLKEKLVEYAICFVAIDGVIDEQEKQLLNLLAQN